MSKPRRGRRGAGYGARDNAAPGSGSGNSRHGRHVLSRKKRTKPPAIRPGAFPVGTRANSGGPRKIEDFVGKGGAAE